MGSLKGGLFLFLIIVMSCFTQKLGEIKNGTGERVFFNRISLFIPPDWHYSKNPLEKPGTDQIQLYSRDRNRTLLITLTKNRPELDFIETEHTMRFEMLRRAMSIPDFKDCSVDGSGLNEFIWGRKGIFTKFDLYEDETKKPDERMMRIYNYGEQIESSDEVLFITAFIIGKEKEDTNIIVKSLEILE